MSDILGRFEARFVHLQKDESVAIVGLADDQFDTTQYIILQRSLQPSQEDISLRQDDLHVMVCDQTRSRYGGLLSVQVATNCITFVLDTNAASDLQVQPHLVVGISEANVDPAVLMAELQRVCGSYAVVTQTG